LCNKLDLCHKQDFFIRVLMSYVLTLSELDKDL